MTRVLQAHAYQRDSLGRKRWSYFPVGLFLSNILSSMQSPTYFSFYKSPSFLTFIQTVNSHPSPNQFFSDASCYSQNKAAFHGCQHLAKSAPDSSVSTLGCHFIPARSTTQNSGTWQHSFPHSKTCYCFTHFSFKPRGTELPLQECTHTESLPSGLSLSKLKQVSL